jgi:sec-independent protein translocase protein TatA
MGLSGVSPGSLLLIGLVALIFFGPEKMKKIAHDLGEALAAFKRGIERSDKDSL